ncbi:MAG: copper transporter [Syntrophomonadaceae bacterium]
MIDLRYHIASLVAIFLALGLGVLVGSTIVGDDVLVQQQKKMIDRLEEQFYSLKEREDALVAENKRSTQIIADYENFSQTLLPPIVTNRLKGYQVAVVVTGSNDIPAAMLNAFSIAGANVVSKTVVLPNINMNDAGVRNKLIEFYNLDNKVSRDLLRKKVAASVVGAITNQGDPDTIKHLQENGLIKFSGSFNIPINGVVIVGGSEDLTTYFPDSFDQSLIDNLTALGIKVYGTELSGVKYSYMAKYQQNNISTIDNINMGPGQISLILAIAGEPGDYGIKATAKKFMASLPVDYLGGQ